MSAGLACVVQTGPPDRREPAGRPEPDAQRDRRRAHRRHGVHRRRRRPARHRDRRPVPRHRPERAPALGRLHVLAGHRERAHPDPRRRHRRPPRPRRDHALEGAALADGARRHDRNLRQIRQGNERGDTHETFDPARLAIGAATLAITLVTAVTAYAADDIGESSPILSNPNQQAITRGEQLAAKTLRLEGQDDRREPLGRQAGLRRRHARQPGRQGPDHLDARRRRRGRRLQARARQGHPGHRLRLDLQRHLDRLRRARLSLHGRRQGRRVHRQARPQGQGARDRRPAGAVHHELHQLLREGREGRRAAGRRQAEQRQGHRRDRSADRPGPDDEEPRHQRHLVLQRSELPRSRRRRALVAARRPGSRASRRAS